MIETGRAVPITRKYVVISSIVSSAKKRVRNDGKKKNPAGQPMHTQLHAEKVSKRQYQASNRRVSIDQSKSKS